MSEGAVPRVDFDEIMGRIRAEVLRRRQDPTPIPDVSENALPRAEVAVLTGTAKGAIDLSPPDLARVDASLFAAEQVADVGARLPPMHRQRGIKRSLATFIARVFLRIAQLITRDQRLFNRSVIGSLRDLGSALRDQNWGFRGALGKLSSALGSQADSLTALDRQFSEALRKLEARIEAIGQQSEAAVARTRQDMALRFDEVAQRQAGLEGRIEQALKETQAVRSAVSETAATLQQEQQASTALVMARAADASDGAVSGLRKEMAGRLEEVAQREVGLAGMIEHVTDETRLLRSALSDAATTLQKELQGSTAQVMARTAEASNAAVSGLRQEIALRLEEVAKRPARLEGLLDQVVAETVALRASISETAALLQKELHGSTAQVMTLAAEQSRALQARLQGLTGDFDRDRTKLGELQVAQRLQERRISTLLEAMRHPPERSQEKKVVEVVEQEQGHLLDSMYLEFEDAYRGTREDIKLRAREYMLAPVREAGAGAPERPILDLGCGRGEWLELLRDEGLQGRGLDVNRAFVQECRDRKLEVEESDALTYLKTLPDGCLGGVTAVHLLEHVPFEVLIGILDQTVRVLKSGGLAIFETPNPTNLSVGACDFYRDPTHRNPLHPETMQFLAERRGLVRVAALPLHPYPPEYQLPDDGTPLTRRLNAFFYGPRDFAILGYRA